MRYPSMCPALFLERLNRFTAQIQIEDQTHLAHVKNTGRLRELLLPHTPVYVQRCDSPMRKTAYDLISVCRQDGSWVNIDSQAPNAVLAEFLPRLFPDQEIRSEYTWKDSRFDFKVGERVLIEAKGVTLLCEDGIARFPDAPTDRGIKHLQGLIHAKEEGWEPYLIFVLAMKGAHGLSPNDKTHPRFGETLRQAAEAGVHILAFDCLVSPDSLGIDQAIPILF